MNKNQNKENIIPEITIRPIDAEILSYVYKYRFLNTEMLIHLLKIKDNRTHHCNRNQNQRKRPTKYGFGKSALYKHLKKLYDGRFLKRHYLTDLPIGGSDGVPRAIYGLGIKSVKVLIEHIGVSPRKIRDIVKANDVKSLYLRHALEIAKFQITLELACKQSNGKVKLLNWSKGKCLLDYVQIQNEYHEKETLSIYPDAFFTLRVDGKKIYNYFLEVDRGSMPIISSGKRTDIRKKILAFMRYKKSKKYQEKYFYHSLPDSQIIGIAIKGDTCKFNKAQIKQLRPIRGFKVLFIVPGKIRQDGILSGRLANILNVLPSFGKAFSTTTLFWFTSHCLINLKQPESVFASMWITSNPKKRIHNLFE